MFNLREFLGLSYYTSPLDTFLAKIKKTMQKTSSSQLKEINKYTHINTLRDNPTCGNGTSATAPKKIWNKF